SLNNEVAYHPTIVGVHPRAIGVEDTSNLDLQLVLPMVVEKQGLSTTLPLVVAGTDANRIHVAPVAFVLRVEHRVAVDFTGRGLQYSCFQALCQPEHIDRAVDACFCGLHRVALVVYRRRWARK